MAGEKVYGGETNGMDESMNEDLLLADGFEDAFLGIGQQFNKQFAIYDKEKCLQILVERDGMTQEDAIEYFDFNVTGAWVGESTPAFLSRMRRI